LRLGHGWRGLSPDYEVVEGFPIESAVAVSGAAFFPQSAPDGSVSDLFVGGELRRVRFDPHAASRVQTADRVLDARYGRISDVVASPGGQLYFCTSNRGSTAADAADDRLLRASPAAR